MGKRGPKPKREKDLIWSPELAYACGLMATDGCLSKDGRHLNLTSKDIDQLETFKKCLSIKSKISWKRRGRRGEDNRLCSQIQFGDVKLYQWFVSIGITPQKTFTLNKVRIPDSYFFDFLRGEFDGDGHSHAYWDTRWRSSVLIYINFNSASINHLKWIDKTILRLIGLKGIINKGS